MNHKQCSAVLASMAALCVAGAHLLTAQEPLPRAARATPSQIKAAQTERLTLTATVPHSVGRTIRELNELAADLENAGHKSEAARLRNAVKEIVRRAEQELAEKNTQAIRLNEEIAELKAAISP